MLSLLHGGLLLSADVGCEGVRIYISSYCNFTSTTVALFLS